MYIDCDPKIIFALKDWSEPGEWGFSGPEAEKHFADEVESYDGKEIIKIKKTNEGYYDITFIDGHCLEAVSGLHLMMLAN
jgi:hypothetical protein